MSPAPKTDERTTRVQAVRVPLSRRLSSGLKAVGTFLRRIIRSGKQRFTIMFIPHSEKRVLNVQVNSFAIIFVGVLAVVVVAGFFYLATVFSGSERIAEETGTRLEAAEANLDQVRSELVAFLDVYDDFESALASTLGRLDIGDGSNGETPSRAGDLASLLDLEEVSDQDAREILDLQRVIASLRGSIGPLNEISDVLDLHQQLLSDIPTLWPVVNGLGWITMEFGPNIHPIRGIWYMHKGIDIAHFVGTPIVAAADGTVTRISNDVASSGGYGRTIEIDHNYGFKTKYGHLAQIEVREGEEVSQGERIGQMGNTGTSTGPHLDFIIMIGTEIIDPAHFLKLSTPNFERRSVVRRSSLRQ